MLTLTAIHDRYLVDKPSQKNRIAEIYHLSRAVTLFKQKLSDPIQLGDRDALWATAALLGMVTFSLIDALKPEDAWPLKDSDSTDLEWMQLGESKQTIWTIADPMRTESLFHHQATDYYNAWMEVLASNTTLEDIPMQFIQLYSLNEMTSAENNVYFRPLLGLAAVLSCTKPPLVIMHFNIFMSHMESRFKMLLIQKDPRALLIISYWYSTVCDTSIWWMQRRALLECQAICMYLEKYHAYDTSIQELLQFPKIQCGFSRWKPGYPVDLQIPSLEASM